MTIKSGVVPLNDSYFKWLPQVPDSFLQSMALASFGGMYEQSTFAGVDVTLIGELDGTDCLPGTNNCMQLYLTQASPRLQDLPGQNAQAPFLKLFQTPIYHVFLGNASENYPIELLMASGNCLFYGYRPSGLVMCARSIQRRYHEHSFLVGK